MLVRKILFVLLLLSSFTLCLLAIYMGYKLNESRYKERKERDKKNEV